MAGPIAIIDFGMGNLRSIRNALRAVGADVVVADIPDQLADASAIVLPGVGAFEQGKRRLDVGGWTPALGEAVFKAGKPLLGICLGMQLLANSSEEFGHTAGLGWLPGTVRKLVVGEHERLPHVGWNDVRIDVEGGLYAGIKSPAVFYFVHSFGFFPDDPGIVTARCEYGQVFAASIRYDNIYATQYHPEKSHESGLAVLRNFVAVCRA